MINQPIDNTTDFLIRPYQPGDEKEINVGFNKIFGQNRDLSEWYWKFQSLNKSRILLAFGSNDKLISHYGVVTDRFKYFGKIYNAGHSVDTFSARMPAAINQRIFEKLVHKFFGLYGNQDDISLMYGFPGKRILSLGTLKLDYGAAFPIKYWERSILNKPWFVTFSKRSYRLNLKKVDKLWQGASDRYPISIVRDSLWIRKRYLSRPGALYCYLKTSRLGVYSSICIYRIEKDSLAVVDLVWDGKRRKDLRKIDRLLAQSAARLGLSRLTMWLSGDDEAEQIFSEIGWNTKQEPQKLHLVVKSFSKEIDRQKLLDHFYLTKGCTDII